MIKIKRIACSFLLISSLIVGGSSVYADIEPRFANTIEPRFADPIEPRSADPIPSTATPAVQPSSTTTTKPTTSSQPTKNPTPSTEKTTLLTSLKSGTTNYGRTLQTGKVYGDYFYITFTGYNEQTGEFGGTIEWPQYKTVDTIVGKVQGDKLVFSQVSGSSNVNSIITVRMTDSNHLSGTWSMPGTNKTGTIKFTINPNDVSHLQHTYKIFVPSSSATLETKNYYITKTSAGALNGNVTIKSDGTYIWNSAVDGKVIKGKWSKTKDIAYPIVLLKGERGRDWKIGESVHSGADIVLWDGVSSQKADLVK